MELKIIVAMDEQNGIGYNNKLLWHLPKDLKWFKEQTNNKIIIMGKNCYLDIISYTKGKPLPNRVNVILSKSLKPKDVQPGFLIFKDKEYLLKYFSYEKEIFIIGGGQIYNEFINQADELIVTHVHKTFLADVFFPQINYSNFITIFEQQETENNINYTFTKYRKKT
jgi:dihydrofolate reductase